ncbi:hypothetical protein CUU62_27490 [Pseudomonas sp. WP001]|nr:hypothetical protein CUU62_27490 [Pseudomonas sp. WP001]
MFAIYGSLMIVPTLCVGMHPVTLCVTCRRDAERPRRHSHAERGNDQTDTPTSGQAPSHMGSPFVCHPALCLPYRL